MKFRSKPTNIGTAFGLMGMGIFIFLWGMSGTYLLFFGPYSLQILGLLGVLASLVFIYYELRPTVLILEQGGLRTKATGIRRLVPWSEIESVVLEPHSTETSSSPILVLVPTPSSRLRARAERSSGQPSIQLLTLDKLYLPKDEALAAFRAHLGGRFIDATVSRKS